MLELVAILLLIFVVGFTGFIFGGYPGGGGGGCSNGRGGCGCGGGCGCEGGCEGGCGLYILLSNFF